MVNILHVNFGIAKPPNCFITVIQRAGVSELAIHLNDFLLATARLIILTGRTNADQGISNLESHQHLHLFKIKAEN